MVVVIDAVAIVALFTTCTIVIYVDALTIIALLATVTGRTFHDLTTDIVDGPTLGSFIVTNRFVSARFLAYAVASVADVIALVAVGA